MWTTKRRRSSSSPRTMASDSYSLAIKRLQLAVDAAGAVELQVELQVELAATLAATLAVKESPRLRVRCTSQQTTPQQRKQDAV